MERRYRRTGKESDKETYDAAAAATQCSIMKSRADTFRSELAEVQGDQRATWRVANRLHSKPRCITATMNELRPIAKLGL